jgi:excisionase family DNA binding protein
VSDLSLNLFQIPIQREGFVGPTSTEFQVMREIDAGFGVGSLNDGTRRRLLDRVVRRRLAEAEERERKRRRREERWKLIQAGEIDPEFQTETGKARFSRRRDLDVREPEELLSVEEAAQKLGVSRSALDARIARGAVRVIREGNRVLVPVAEVERLTAPLVSEDGQPAMRLVDAAKRLGLTGDQMQGRIRRGLVATVTLVSGKKAIAVEVVEALEREAVETPSSPSSSDPLEALAAAVDAAPA